MHYEDGELQSDAYLLVVHGLCGVEHESVENLNVSQLWGFPLWFDGLGMGKVVNQRVLINFKFHSTFVVKVF